MGRYKYLLKNIGILTLSSFATKFLSFFLVPLYTQYLTTEEFGTFDLLATTIAILVPVLTVNIQEAVLRFTIEDKNKSKGIMSIAIYYFIFSVIITSLILIVVCHYGSSSIFAKYWGFFVILFILQAFLGILLSYTRGIEKISVLSFSSFICALSIIVLNILFLVIFRWGLLGYFFANILGYIIQCFYLMYKIDFFSLSSFFYYDKELKKDMISYSRPLIANSIAWWINNASDRYILNFFCGLSVTGIYSVSSKIPSVLNIFQSIFSQAWSLSAVKEFDEDDSNGFFTMTYSLYNSSMVIVCSLIIILNRAFAKILYANAFYDAWICVPWLSIAIIFGALSGYLGGFFSATKKSKVYAKSTVIGAICNIILNLVLIPTIGMLGAAIATTICYIITWYIRLFQVKRFVKMKIELRKHVISYIILITQSIIFYMINNRIVLYLLEIFCLTCILIIYRQIIYKLLSKISMYK